MTGKVQAIKLPLVKACLDAPIIIIIGPPGQLLLRTG
jgi:hypothetical protein